MVKQIQTIIVQYTLKRLINRYRIMHNIEDSLRLEIVFFILFKIKKGCKNYDGRIVFRGGKVKFLSASLLKNILQ